VFRALRAVVMPVWPQIAALLAAGEVACGSRV